MHFFSVYSLFVSIGSLFVFCFPEEASDVGVKSMQSLPNVQVCNTEAGIPFDSVNCIHVNITNVNRSSQTLCYWIVIVMLIVYL